MMPPMNPRRCIVHYCRSSSRNPDFASAWQSLTKVLGHVPPERQEQFLAVRDTLQINPALRVDPPAARRLLAKAGNDRVKLLALATLAEMTERPVLGEQALRRILKDHPDDVPVAVMLGERLADQCRWDDLIAFAKAQIDKHPQEGAFHRLLGTAYDGLDDLKPAMNSLYDSLRLNKRDVKAMWQAAQINDRLNQREPAVTIYQVIVATRPDFWPAHIALVRAYLQTGQQSLAIQHARKLKELLPDVPAVDLCLAIAESGRPVPPSDRIIPLLNRYGPDPELLHAAAQALFQENKIPQTIEVLNKFLAEKPDDEDGRLLLATALSQQMDYDLARQVLHSLLVEHPNRRIWQLADAELLLQDGKPEQAVPILRRLMTSRWDTDQKLALLDRLVFAWELRRPV